MINELSKNFNNSINNYVIIAGTIIESGALSNVYERMSEFCVK